MRYPMPGVALLFLLGCGDGSSAPSGPILLGQWGLGGDSPALLTGLRVGAELELTCSWVGINQPVELSADGGFVFEGRFNVSGPPGGSRKARVSGRVEGESVSLTLDVLGDGAPAQPLALQAGVDPDFENLPPVCPQ